MSYKNEINIGLYNEEIIVIVYKCLCIDFRCILGKNNDIYNIKFFYKYILVSVFFRIFFIFR